VRLEDKELEGPDLERAQRIGPREERETDEAEHQLPDTATIAVEDIELQHRSRLFDALELILADEALDVELLYLPQRETRALEFLQAAVTGRDQMGMFVFADDRAQLLEQALAVLQQNLTHGSAATLAQLQSKYDQLADHVAGLRERLIDLEDAQDDLMEPRVHREVTATPGQPPELDDRPEDSITGFIASALQALAAVAGTDVNTLQSTLDGPELPDQPAPPSTLSGPDRPAAPRPPSQLDGPALPDSPPAPSTLDGPEPPARAFASTLDGPPLPDEPARSSTLGDDDEIAAAAPAVRPVRRSSPTIEPPTRRPSSPAIEPPARNKFPSVAPPIRTGRATTPPLGLPTEPDARAPRTPPAVADEPARPGLALRSSDRAAASKAAGSEPSAEPVRHGLSVQAADRNRPVPPRPEDDKPAPAPVRRGLSVRSTDRAAPAPEEPPVTITAPEPAPEPAKPRRGLAVRSTDKPKDKK